MFTCGVVTFNCCLSVCPPLRFNGAFSRATHLADAFYTSLSHHGVDIICLQELIVNDSFVLSQFIHHKNHTTRLFAPFGISNFFRVLSSGLYILTKWDIVDEEGYVFECESYHAEMFMAKGVQYAKIRMNNNKYVHVFNTHLQAWTNQRAISIRTEQMTQVAQLMRKKLLGCDFSRELVCLAVDTNCDAYEHSKILQACLSIAHLRPLMPVIPQFSFDSSENPLVGLLDDPNEYQIRNNQNNTSNNGGYVKTCPKQLIDIVATHELQQELVQCAEVNVVPIRTLVPFIFNVDISTQQKHVDVSDHFAVFCRIEFIESSTKINHRIIFTHGSQKRPNHHFRSAVYSLTITIKVGLCIGVFFVFLLSVVRLFRSHKK